MSDSVTTRRRRVGPELARGWLRARRATSPTLVYCAINTRTYSNHGRDARATWHGRPAREIQTGDVRLEKVTP